MEEFNGFNFDDKQTRKKMKFIIVTRGDLDVNNAYAFKSKKELKEYCKSKYNQEKIYAIFEIKDITGELKC